jgi:hypothetical protein
MGRRVRKTGVRGSSTTPVAGAVQNYDYSQFENDVREDVRDTTTITTDTGLNTDTTTTVDGGVGGA